MIGRDLWRPLGRAPLHFKKLQVPVPQRSELRALILHLRNRGKFRQSAVVRESVGKQLREGLGRRHADWLVGQQVFEGDLVGVHRTSIFGIACQTLMTHFRDTSARIFCGTGRGSLWRRGAPLLALVSYVPNRQQHALASILEQVAIR